MTLVVGYAPASPDGTHWGGTLILLNNALLDYKSTHHNSEHAVVVNVEWGGTPLQIASVYAPVRPLARVNFFSTIQNLLTVDTIAGGDWNCVADVTTDVQSSNPLGYRNEGARLLAERLGRLGLNDERGDQLDGDSEITRAGNSANGYVGTRIDRWFIPTTSNYDHTLWTFELTNTFLFKRTASDHSGVLLTIDKQRGELGHDRRTVREDLLLDRDIQTHILALLKTAYKGNKSNANKWVDANNKIRDYLMSETAKRRKKDSKQINLKTAILKIIQTKLKKQQPTQRLLDQQARVQKELYDLKFPEVQELPTNERAYSMHQSSDTCSKQQFMPYKQQAKRAWVNEMKVAEWEEGKEPNFTGTTSHTQACSNEFAKYYRMLFEAKHTDPACSNILLRALRKKKILRESRRMLDAEITVEEVLEAMENLPIGKQPGPNRVPNAVYKYMSKHFAPKLVAVLNEAIEQDRLPKHFLEGDISVLYKKNERTDPRNYRPITLLNTDYKVFTRVLARRMCRVVHEFVAENQKGFVPHAFIAEATTMLGLIEAYINEEPLERKGILLFLDMEKAFDRVSYSFTKQGLNALGFGDADSANTDPNNPSRFCKWIGMMYNENKAPKRRIYVNGYYSEWFDIKSGVAQGCPLSPLLFLVVAEALRASIELEPRLKGIKIGDRRYLLSQFADDTTLMLQSKKEIKYVNRAIRRWCKATGMRENAAKREGVKMGRYRHTNIAEPGIKWAPEGGYVKSLGVPVGNDLDTEKWWKVKLAAIRAKTDHWAGLYRSSYFGRNLIVQGMYFGRLRYWLYSLPMSRAMIDMVQRDANILWWSREPKVNIANDPNGEALKNDKRIRRWVRAATAIGPRRKGGLNTMDWATHVSSFTAQWMFRYVQPGDSSWKDLLDHFLLNSKSGKELYPEGRVIVFSNLSVSAKRAMLQRLPKKAKYMRECLKSFWKLKLQPIYENSRWEGIEADLFWHSHRCQHVAAPHEIRYCKDTLNVLTFSDIVDHTTNQLFTRDQWRDFVEDIEEERTGVTPSNHFILTKGDMIYDLTKRMDRELVDGLLTNLAQPHSPRSYAYLTKEGKDNIPVKVTSRGLEVIWVDGLAIGHPTGKVRDQRDWELVEASMWREEKREPRWIGPKGASFPSNSEWMIGDHVSSLGQMTIKVLTKSRVHAKAQPPPAQKVWEEKLGLNQLNWDKTWGIRSFFTTPRDEVTWLKIQHRNLWVASRDPKVADPTCNAPGCTQVESMLHLAECTIIWREFWDKILNIMSAVGLRTARTRDYILLGRIGPRKYVDREEAGILFIAWRCLYAQVVNARLETTTLKLASAYARTIRLVISRLKANGTKWYRWYSRTRHIQTPKVKLFPLRYRKRKLIKTTSTAEFTINPRLIAEYERIKAHI